MNDDRPFLQVPLEREEEFRAYEEWLKKQKEHEKKDDEETVVIIDI